MKILFVSGELIGSALCQKLIKEGNEVRLHIHQHDWKNCLTGIVSKIDDWRAELMWVGKDGLIVFDDVIFGEFQDWLRHFGYLVVGSSMKGDELELNRRYFQEIAEKEGIKVLPSYNFLTATEASQFVKNNATRWVVKQSTHISSLNYVGEHDDGRDVLQVLRKYKRKRISPIHLQRHAEGIEVGVARYFNGNDWVGPIEINHEHKRLNDGNTGPLTPEMGTILWYTESENRLFTETLGKLKSHLQSIDFRGDIDINCMVTKDEAWPIEATPRFGTPSTQIQIELHKSPWKDFLSAIANGQQYDLKYHHQFGIAICITIPPFPYVKSTKQKIQSIFEKERIQFHTSLTDEERGHIHLEEVSKDDSGYYWAGQQGWVMHVTGKGETIDAAREHAYSIVRKVIIPKMHYRTDIGVRVEKYDLPSLKQWGWI